ncbi:hypothetical protein FRB93_004685 [Tulasnella sp. JGI-2019a]|nr:hypothetical protein FRB93_004685 [Tulasnella sp. JGI-2019a]
MSPTKRKKTRPDPQSVYDAIVVALIPIKASLDHPILTPNEELVERLSRIASLSESFSYPGSQEESVALWNYSLAFRPEGNSELHHARIFAFLRLASYRLIEAGMHRDAGIQTLIHVLQLATKAASALFECEEANRAGSILTRAADLEARLQKAEDPTNEFGRAKAGAIVSYYSSRMEGAWREDNEPVSFFMLKQATSDQQIQHLIPGDIELLATKVFDQGKSLLYINDLSEHGQVDAPAAQRAAVSVKWLQQALRLSEALNAQALMGNPRLKNGILRSLARAYFLSSTIDPAHLGCAETTVAELTSVTDADGTDPRSEEAQQLRWMTLSILKRKRAGELEVVEAFKSIIHHMLFNENNVTEMIQEIALLPYTRSVNAGITRILLETALDSGKSSGHAYIDRIVVAFIFSCKTANDHDAVIQDLKTVLTAIAEHPVYSLDKTAATASQSLLFQIGGRYYQEKQYLIAANWFDLCTHPVFRAIAASSHSKCLRKMALCYIEAGQHAKASEVIARCSGNEAATHYVAFLCVAYQGLEEEAIQAMHQMVKASDFDRKMLLLATQLAHDNQMRGLLLAVLESLLKTLKETSGRETEVEAITLVRCLIRITLDSLKAPLADTPSLLSSLMRHLSTAYDIIDGATTKRVAPLIVKDVSWLWRISFNTAVQGSSGWDEFRVADLFDHAYRLMDLYNKIAVGNPLAETSYQMLMASFSSICARVFGLRRTEQGNDITTFRSRVVHDIQAFRTMTSQLSTYIQTDEDPNRMSSFVNLSFVFEVEQICHLKQWSDLGSVVREATGSKHDIGTEAIEAIADLLWVEPACPASVLYLTLETLLKSSLDCGHIGREKFSRWLRAIVTILLARDRPSDRIKALGFVEQAIDVMKDVDEDEELYPADEQQWLLSTSYNAGVESFQLTQLDEAKRWFEAATMVARVVKGGTDKARQIEEAYRALLARYSDHGNAS